MTTEPVQIPQKFKAVVRSRTETLFSGIVHNVFSTSSRGEFAVMPGHANFISLITDYVVMDKGHDDEKKLTFSKATLTVIDGEVEVYVGI